MEFVLVKDKECKHSIRYADGNGHNIYLQNEEVKELGSPKVLVVSIAAKQVK